MKRKKYIITEQGVLNAVITGSSILGSIISSLESISALKNYAANILGIGQRIKATDVALNSIQNDPEINVLKSKKEAINKIMQEIEKINNEINTASERLIQLKQNASSNNINPTEVMAELDTLNKLILSNKQKLYVLKTKANTLIKDYNEYLSKLKEKYS